MNFDHGDIGFAAGRCLALGWTQGAIRLARLSFDLLNQPRGMQQPVEFNVSHKPTQNFVLRLRNEEGLPNAELDHPLMAQPLAGLPMAPPPYSDPLLDRVLARIRAEWPEVSASA